MVKILNFKVFEDFVVWYRIQKLNVYQEMMNVLMWEYFGLSDINIVGVIYFCCKKKKV